jgi:hypothetical protein
VKTLKVILLAGVIGSPFSASHAHHSYAGVFDMSSIVQFEARVVKLELRNPHAVVHIEIVNERGDVEQWTIEGPGKLSLARRGWADDMFEAGEEITVYGNPSVRGKPILWLSKIVKSDGVELVDPLVDDALAIEKERRARLSRTRQDE